MLNPRQIRILVVDDERAIRELLASRFSIFGFQAVTAENGQAAWEMICADSAIKIVVCDLVMPTMDGKELLRLCRQANPEYPRIFLMTGKTEWSREELYALGADGLLVKPFDARSLLGISRHSLLTLEERLRYAPYKKSSAQINAAFPSLDKALMSGRFALGRGGMFLMQSQPIPNEGENIDFQIQLGEIALTGVGEVRWRRSDGSGQWLAGIEFLHLQPSAIEFLKSYLPQLSWGTFIPSPQISISMPSTAKLQSTG